MGIRHIKLREERIHRVLTHFLLLNTGGFLAIHLTHYAKIKDRYCIAYLGNCNEYILQLKHLRPYFENEFPGIKVSLCFKDDLLHLVEGESNIIPYSKIKEQKRQFAYIREILCNMQEHPIEAFVVESEIEIPPCLCKWRNTSATCGIYPKGTLPTKSMSDSQVEKAKKFAAQQNLTPVVNASPTEVGWAIGVENEQLFKAGMNGSEVTLVNNGLGSNLFSKMFPSGEVVDW